MGNMKEEVYLGSKDTQTRKFGILAQMAQPENWTFKKIKESDPYRILRNYIIFTYNRLDEENKILLSQNGNYRCMNTGLLTVYNQEIIALFAKSDLQGVFPWYLVGFFKENDKRISLFSELPQIANYYADATELIYDNTLELTLQKEHIIDDNIQRFIDIGYTDKELISSVLDSAKNILEKKLKRNFKLALPFYYHNTETGKNKIQLLAPLYLPGGNVRLALVINKVQSNKTYYEGITVIPVEWAYMNARLIAKPDEEWAKIIDETDNDIEKSNFTKKDFSQNDIDRFD